MAGLVGVSKAAKGKQLRKSMAKRRLVALGCVVAVGAVLTGCTAVGDGESVSALGGSQALDGSPGVASQRADFTGQALDLLAPVERETFSEARSDFHAAVWAIVEPEWTLCAETNGLKVPADVGFELSYYGIAAVANFEAPSVLRDQGGATLFYGEAATSMSSKEGTLLQGCNDRIDQVLSGGEPASEDVDQARLEAAREALDITASEASTVPRLFDEVIQMSEDGKWKPVVQCLSDKGIAIPEDLSNSPNATLSALGLSTDELDTAEELQRQITLAQPGIAAYVDCSLSFYDELSSALASYRAEVIGSHGPAVAQLAQALAVVAQ